MYDANGNEWTIEGEPQKAQLFNWGKLTVSVLENSYGPNDNPSKDTLFGQKNVIPCGQVAADVSIAQSFKTTAQYEPGGPNSNSFMSWFLNLTGLIKSYPTAPPGSVGWNKPIPGDPY
jgi:hypothetical protein